METYEDRPALPEKYGRIPLGALGTSTRKKLSLFLNLEGTLNDDVQCENNYRGLAEMAGFSYLEIKNFEIQKSPTEEMLHEWTVRQDLSPTVGQLWSFLSILEREDVLTDCYMYIFKDCEAYLEKKAKFASATAPIQEATVTQSTDPSSSLRDLMTVHDVEKGTPTMYDAFVCYNAEGPDLEFVMEMIRRLEGKEYGMKLFIPERDNLAGLADSTTIAKLIEHRCKRMVIVLSPRFLTSTSCDFQTKFAQSLSPGARSKKLVPILIEHCNVPEIIRFVTLCDYTKKDLIQWFWTRLASSLKAPLEYLPTDQEASGTSGSVRSETDQSSSLFSWNSGSSLGSSGSNNASSLGSSSSSSSHSHSPRLSHSSRSQAENRAHSHQSMSREGEYVMVTHKEIASRPPQVPPTGNRAPLPKLGSSTPPPTRGSNFSPQNKAANTPPINRVVYSSPHNKGCLTPPVNRPLPRPPVDQKDETEEKVYFC